MNLHEYCTNIKKMSKKSNNTIKENIDMFMFTLHGNYYSSYDIMETIEEFL